MGKRESAWQIDPFRRGYFVCVQGYGQGSYVLAMCSHLFISAAHKTHQRQLTLTQAISEPAQERAPALHSRSLSLWLTRLGGGTHSHDINYLTLTGLHSPQSGNI